MALTPIDGQETEELPTIPREELENTDKEAISYEITVCEEKLNSMKPNMAAIAEYRKKVGDVCVLVGRANTNNFFHAQLS